MSLPNEPNPAAGAPCRVERDLLGEAAILQDALYGIRTQRCVENMSFSGKRLGNYPTFIRALALVKKAAAIANFRCGVLDQKAMTAIVAACDALISGAHLEQFVVDVFAGGGSIAVNSNVNEVVANLANETLGGQRGVYFPLDPKTHVNASQSTADVCHSALHIAILTQWKALDHQLQRLVDTSREKASETADVQVIARTCMQAAMAASLGDTFGAFGTMLARRRENLELMTRRLRQINLGGTVIGTGEGAPAAYRQIVVTLLSDVSGLDVELDSNLIDAAQNIDRLADVAASLSLLAGSLIKVAKDLRLMAAGSNAGFGEIELPAVQEGSSFFKGKINPVMPETLIQSCFLIISAEQVVRAALEHGELNLNVYEGAAGIAVLEAVSILTASLCNFHDRCLVGIKANDERSLLYEETLVQLQRGNFVEPGHA